MTPKVKICGITTIDDALAALEAGADALGFVFYKKSTRYIKPREARTIIARLPPQVLKVGVFVNEQIATVKNIARQCALDFVQLHGDEDANYLRRLKNFRIIKAIRIRDEKSLGQSDGVPCELLLFDTYSKSGFGGTGTAFDWRLARDIKKTKKPYIISGGLTPKNVAFAVKKFSPCAVDVSSGVEKKPGKKDSRRMKEFIKNAKQK